MLIDPQTETAGIAESQTSEVSNLTPNSPKKKNALPYVIFGLLLLVILIGVGLMGTRLIKTTVMPTAPSTKTTPSSLITKPTETTLRTYTNKLGGYSFDYPSTLAIQWTGMSVDPADSEIIHIVPGAEIESATGMTIHISNPVGPAYASEQELIEKGLLEYWSSSTSQFLTPENNTVTPIKTADRTYTYEVSWKNDPLYGEAGEGVEVWTFYPLAQYTYPLTTNVSEMPKILWVRYDKKDTDLYAEVLNSLQLKPIPQSE